MKDNKKQIATKIYRLLRMFSLATIVFGLILACSGKPTQNPSLNSHSSTSKCRVVKHVMGETCVPLNPHRIVTTDSLLLEPLLALDIKPIASRFPELQRGRSRHLSGKIDGIASLGIGESLNLETILQMKPDLILGWDSQIKKDYNLLSQIAPTVVLNYSQSDLNNCGGVNWKDCLQRTGELLDKSQQVVQLLDDYQQRVETIRKALGKHLSEIDVSIARFYWDGRMDTQNHPSYFAGSILQDIGFFIPTKQRQVNAYSPLNISLECLNLLDGDVMFAVISRSKDSKKYFQKYQKNLLWQQLKVVQNKQVFKVDGSYWLWGSVIAANAVLDDLFKYLVEDKK
jgi:iron complex transport system substrate-binding protein